MNIEKLSQQLGSRKLLYAIAAILLLGVLCAVFQLGEFVGFHKALFAAHWGENYERNFGTPHDKFGALTTRGPNPHGASGRIVSITLPTLTIVNDFEDEKIISIASSTLIRKGSATIPATALVAGDAAVVLGVPNDQGEITATLIRILPVAPTR